MSVWGKLAGAAAGLAVGGPIGALVGGVAGHYAIDRDEEKGGSAENQVAFTVGVIALGAKMAKADGVVTMDEVNAFKEVFKVPDGEMKNVARVFNLAKQDMSGYDAYAEQLATMFKGNRKLLEDVLEGLFHIAKRRDGVKLVQIELVSLKQAERLLQLLLCPLCISLGCLAGQEAHLSVGLECRSKTFLSVAVSWGYIEIVDSPVDRFGHVVGRFLGCHILDDNPAEADDRNHVFGSPVLAFRNRGRRPLAGLQPLLGAQIDRIHH